MFEGLFQPMHLLVIFGLALFGPKKLPELGKGLGESIRGFKSAMKTEEDKTSMAASSAQQKPNSKKLRRLSNPNSPRHLKTSIQRDRDPLPSCVKTIEPAKNVGIGTAIVEHL